MALSGVVCIYFFLHGNMQRKNLCNSQLSNVLTMEFVYNSNSLKHYIPTFTQLYIRESTSLMNRIV